MIRIEVEARGYSYKNKDPYDEGPLSFFPPPPIFWLFFPFFMSNMPLF